MKFIVVILALVCSQKSWSTVVIGKQDCPQKFEGRVREMLESKSSNDFFSMSKVTFENERLVEGQVDQLVSVNVLKNGPFQIEVGKVYKVHLRQGRLCWMEEI